MCFAQSRILSLPMFAEITEDQLRIVIHLARTRRRQLFFADDWSV
jgi:hypothetical protein